jgi:hypothetical protein
MNRVLGQLRGFWDERNGKHGRTFKICGTEVLIFVQHKSQREDRYRKENI